MRVVVRCSGGTRSIFFPVYVVRHQEPPCRTTMDRPRPNQRRRWLVCLARPFLSRGYRWPVGRYVYSAIVSRVVYLSRQVFFPRVCPLLRINFFFFVLFFSGPFRRRTLSETPMARISTRKLFDKSSLPRWGVAKNKPQYIYFKKRKTSPNIAIYF